VKRNDSAAVWYIEDGKLRLIPSYSSFVLLGLKDSDIDTLSPSFITSLPSNGIKLASGQLVKDPTSAAVYTIANNQRLLFASSDSFIAYHNNWNTIETYPSSALDQYYPYLSVAANDILVDKANSKVYLISPNSCFTLDSNHLAAIGKDYTSLSNAQTYDLAAFRNLNLTSCVAGTSFIKQPGQSLVYWLDGGQKHPLNTYSAMLSKNNSQPPVVMEAGSAFLSTIPTGSSYN
jgi:hypothetical protein